MSTPKFLQGSERVRLMYVVTSWLTVRLLSGQLDYLREMGFEVVLVSSAGEELRKAEREGVRTVAVEMKREIAPWKDLRSLWMLLKAVRQLRPMIVNFSNPKAGLLGGIAARFSGVPCRIYMLRGLRCETAKGLKRKVLMVAERIACACAHRVICVSESMRQKAIDLSVVEANRTVVLGGGSSNGVEMNRFAPTQGALRRGRQLREKLGIPADAPVVGFVGRLTKDKGINELAEAYCELRKQIAELRLLLVGEMEKGDPLSERTRWLLENEPGIVRTGFVDDPADYYHVLDVFAFPSYREGLPNVILEAHAAGKAVVATRATGVVDVVDDGMSGLLVPIGDSKALAEACARLLREPQLAEEMGRAGRARVMKAFRQEIVWQAVLEEYRRLLEERVVPEGNRAVRTASGMTKAIAKQLS